MDGSKETAVTTPNATEQHSSEQSMKETDIQQQKGNIMSDGMQDKVEVQNIFKPGHGDEGGGGFGNLAAVAGLLGGGNNARDNNVIPALMALSGGRHGHHDGYGNGAAWGVGGLVLGALLGGNRRGGLFGGGGGDGDCGNAVFDIATTQGIGDIKAAVALSAAQTENVVNTATNVVNTNVLQQTLALANQGFQAQLANQGGFANVKDSVQTTSVGNLIATNNVGLAVERGNFAVTQAVQADGEKTRALITNFETANLNRQLSDAHAAIIELRNEGRINERTRGIEINMTNTQTQIQAQAQAQAQLQGITTLLTSLAGELQVQRQGIVNLGTMVGNTQSAANTSVR